MKDTVLVSMGVLALMVALNDGWIYYLKGWISASVGGPGISGVANNANNEVAPSYPQFSQPGATAGTSLVNTPRSTSVGNQTLD